ncbi:MAG: hypothetical protein WC444_06885 [Candidatus Paceibacterota bacterium]
MARITTEVYYHGELFYIDENNLLYRPKILEHTIHPERYSSDDFLQVSISDSKLEEMLRTAITDEIKQHGGKKR